LSGLLQPLHTLFKARQARFERECLAEQQADAAAEQRAGEAITAAADKAADEGKD
jgi:hypothetical protein